MEEVWEDIEGWEGCYQISNLGRVKSLERSVPCPRWGLRTVKERVLKSRINRSGYLQVRLQLKSASVEAQPYVHRLVAKAFVTGEFDGAHVNHIDNDPTNNRADNLEWCTRQENSDHKVRQGRQSRTGGEDHGQSKLTADAVKYIRANYIPYKVTLRPFAEKYGVSISAVHQAFYGIKWKDVEEVRE